MAVMTLLKTKLVDSVRVNKGNDHIWNGMRTSSLKVEPVSLLRYAGA